MNNRAHEMWLRVASSLLFVLSLMSLLAVAERTTSALWQGYKFLGYETAGAITLSLRTGIGFVVVSILLILACVLVKKLSETKKALISVKLSKWALLILSVSLVVYCVVALSPLNAWRP